MPREIKYEVAGAHDPGRRTDIERRLTELQVPFEWDGIFLVIDAEHEAIVDHVVRLVTGARAHVEAGDALPSAKAAKGSLFGTGDSGRETEPKKLSRGVWITVVVLLAVVGGGLAINSALDSDDTVSTGSEEPNWFEEAVTDCYDEVAYWADLMMANSGNDFAQQDILNEVALEYGGNSDEFMFIARTSSRFVNEAYRVGRGEATAQMSLAIEDWCRDRVQMSSSPGGASEEEVYDGP